MPKDWLGGKWVHEARVRLSGNTDAAKQLIGLGRSMVGHLRDMVGHGGPAVQVIRKNLPDGSSVVARLVNGQAMVDVFAPGVVKASVIRLCAFLLRPISDAALYGYDAPFDENTPGGVAVPLDDRLSAHPEGVYDGSGYDPRYDHLTGIYASTFWCPGGVYRAAPAVDRTYDDASSHDMAKNYAFGALQFDSAAYGSGIDPKLNRYTNAAYVDDKIIVNPISVATEQVIAACGVTLNGIKHAMLVLSKVPVYGASSQVYVKLFTLTGTLKHTHQIVPHTTSPIFTLGSVIGFDDSGRLYIRFITTGTYSGNGYEYRLTANYAAGAYSVTSELLHAGSPSARIAPNRASRLFRWGDVVAAFSDAGNVIGGALMRIDTRNLATGVVTPGKSYVLYPNTIGGLPISSLSDWAYWENGSVSGVSMDRLGSVVIMCARDLFATPKKTYKVYAMPIIGQDKVDVGDYGTPVLLYDASELNDQPEYTEIRNNITVCSSGKSVLLSLAFPYFVVGTTAIGSNRRFHYVGIVINPESMEFHRLLDDLPGMDAIQSVAPL